MEIYTPDQLAAIHDNTDSNYDELFVEACYTANLSMTVGTPDYLGRLGFSVNMLLNHRLSDRPKLAHALVAELESKGWTEVKVFNWDPLFSGFMIYFQRPGSDVLDPEDPLYDVGYQQLDDFNDLANPEMYQSAHQPAWTNMDGYPPLTTTYPEILPEADNTDTTPADQSVGDTDTTSS